jgi:hypothetical protein
VPSYYGLGVCLTRNAGIGSWPKRSKATCSFIVRITLRAGMTPEEARRRALLKLGGIESTKEQYRDRRGFPLLESGAQDLRYALRMLRKNPGFATVAIFSVAIGIGANTAIFSLVSAVLLQPLAYMDPQRLFAVGELLPHLFGQNPVGVNPTHAREWAKQCPSLEHVALMRSNRADIAAGGELASVPGADVSHNLFTLFGVEPLWGRTFLPEEEQEGNHRVIILSESLWRSRFNSDWSLVGKSILVDRQNYQVVGIIPASFRLPYGVTSATNVRFEIFRPLLLGRDEIGRLMGNYNYAAVIRLRRGATAEQALAEINVVQARFPQLAGVQRELKAMLTREALIGVEVGLSAALLIVTGLLATPTVSLCSGERIHTEAGFAIPSQQPNSSSTSKATSLPTWRHCSQEANVSPTMVGSDFSGFLRSGNFGELPLAPGWTP